ncbi:hypothetical protein GF412_01990 [Candidatus Micrarchaeota archaeon]|nr:hypothetical protein [Candidatus Micrarchaeota archaeon]MBD3417733.1 hypothetical protein [Candidatus Micrarchaeota archaeon]
MALDLTIAGTIVALSIVLSGLLIGIGRAIGSHKVEFFGREELIQAVINAALVGAYATITLTATEISREIAGDGICVEGDAIENLQCVYGGLSDNIYILLVESLHLHQTVAYYQSLVLNFSTFTIQPLAYLSSVSIILEAQVLALQQLLLISEIHVQLLAFFGPQLLTFFFPLGLIFRAFFSTRKLGGFLIALSIGLYLLYPSLIMVFPQPELNGTTAGLESMNNNTNYTITPILDLNDNYAIAGKLDNMTNTTAGADFTGDVTTSLQQLTSATSSLTIFILIAPLFSIILTLIFIKEVTDIFGGEFFYSVGML